MKCENCQTLFNSQNRVPKLLPSCGHSLCQQCITNLIRKNPLNFECPFDKLSYSSHQKFNDNLFLLEQLKKNEKQCTNLCKEHNKDQELHCLSCQLNICTNCVLFGIHKNHEYEQTIILYSKMKDNLKEREQQLQVVNEFLNINMKVLFAEIEDIKQEKNQEIKTKFDSIRDLINLQEKRLQNQVDQECKSLIQQTKNLHNNIKSTLNQIQEVSQKGDFQSLNNSKQLGSKEVTNISNNWNISNCQNFKEFYLKKSNFNYQTDNLYNQFKIIINNQNKQEEDNLLDEQLLINEDSVIINDNISSNSFMSRNLSQNSQVYSNLSRIESLGNSLLSQQSGFATNKKNLTRSPIQDLLFSDNSKFNMKQMTERSKQNKENNNQNIQYNKREIFDIIKNQLEKNYLKKSIKLDLSNFNIDDSTIKFFQSKITQLKHLKTIKLNHNIITEQGFKYLLKAIKDLQVEFLYVADNKLKETALDYIISFSKYNNSLKTVCLGGNQFLKSHKKIIQKKRMIESKNIVLVF